MTLNFMRGTTLNKVISVNNTFFYISYISKKNYDRNCNTEPSLLENTLLHQISKMMHSHGFVCLRLVTFNVYF